MTEPTAISSEEQFQELITANKFVMVDFWADWCGPCKAIAPIYKKLAGTHSAAGKLAFAKVDIETPHGAELAKKYTVSAMPSFLVFADGMLGGVARPGHITAAASVVTSDQDRIVMVRGADPKNLTAVAEELARLAKEGGEAV